VAEGNAGPYFANVVANGIPQRELVTPVPKGLYVKSEQGSVLLTYGGALQLTTPLQEVNRQLDVLSWAVIGAGALGIIVAALLGLAVARTALRPLDELTDSVEGISAVLDGTSRLASGSSDELGRLRSAFNRLLDAVESSQASQRQLIMDASHELRTPLTSLRTNVELILGWLNCHPKRGTCSVPTSWPRSTSSPT